MASERQIEFEGSIVGPGALVDSIEQHAPHVVLQGLPGVRVAMVENSASTAMEVSPPMRDHVPTKSYKFESAEQRERFEAAAAQAGLSLGEFIESGGSA